MSLLQHGHAPYEKNQHQNISTTSTDISLTLTSTDKPSSYFLALPREIRNLIFRHLFIHALIHYKPRSRLPLYRKRHLAILTTNRQLHLESRPVLEQQTSLLIQGPLEPALIALHKLVPPSLREGLKTLKLLCPCMCVYWTNPNANTTTQTQTQPPSNGPWQVTSLIPSPSSLISSLPALKTLHLYDDVYGPTIPSYDAMQTITDANLAELISSSCHGLFNAVASHFIDTPQHRYEVLASMQMLCRRGDGSFVRLTALVQVEGWSVLRKGFESYGDGFLERDALEAGF